jgi:protein ImuB
MRSLIIAEPTQSFEECFELDDAVEDLEPLSFLLGRLLDQLCARITARSLSIHVVHLHFVLEPSFEDAFDASTEFLRKKQVVKAYTYTLELPVPCRDAKLLLKLLRIRLQSSSPAAPVQKIRMLAEPARPRMTQGGLFIPDVPDAEKLELTIARIAGVVGEGNVGSPQLVDSHRPDAFRMEKFSIASMPAVDSKEKSKTKMGFRAFRPPVLAKIKLCGGHPAQVVFQGRSGEVVRASGPWRTSGNWWEEDSWQHDAWDLELSFRFENPPAQGLYRVFLDARQDKWFVQGAYD